MLNFISMKPMFRPISSFSLLLGLFLFFSQKAWSQTVAPLVPEVKPPVEGELLERFHDALENGLKKNVVAVTSAEKVREKLRGGTDHASCFSGQCVSANLALFKGHRLAAAHIESIAKNYSIKVRIYSGTTVTGQAEGRCDICTVNEAISATERVAAEAGQKAEAAGATTSGGPQGTMPAQSPGATAGSTHGTAAARSQPSSSPGGALQSSSTSPTPRGRVKWHLWTGIGLASLGVIGLASGIPLIAIDGEGTNCSGPPKPNYAHCKDLYSTAGGGWVLTGMGLAALATSGVMFYLYFSAKPNERTQTGVHTALISPLQEGGWILGASGSF